MSEDEMTDTFARVVPTLVATVVMSTDIAGQVCKNAAENTSSTEVAVTTDRGGGVPRRRRLRDEIAAFTRDVNRGSQTITTRTETREGVHRTTTTTADGARSSIEEVERIP